MTELYLFAIIFCSIAVGAVMEHWRVKWIKHERYAKRRFRGRTRKNLFPFAKHAKAPAAAPAVDATDQLRVVMEADFDKRRILSKSEALVLYAAEKAINDAQLNWRVMAQVSLGEILSSTNSNAYFAINSKRVDMLIISRSGDPIAAIEYQGSGHYLGSAPARDAVKKEALRKAGVRYIEVTPEHEAEDLAREIRRIANVEQMKIVDPNI